MTIPTTPDQGDERRAIHEWLMREHKIEVLGNPEDDTAAVISLGTLRNIARVAMSAAQPVVQEAEEEYSDVQLQTFARSYGVGMTSRLIEMMRALLEVGASIAPHPPVSAEASKGVADAWLFTCKKPGTVMVYATIDPNDANHWPVDQWKSVVREDLFKRPSESVAVSGEVSVGQILALERRCNMTDDEAIRYGRSVLALAGSAKQAAALERMARLDDEMGIEP